MSKKLSEMGLCSMVGLNYEDSDLQDKIHWILWYEIWVYKKEFQAEDKCVSQLELSGGCTGKGRVFGESSNRPGVQR